MAEPQQGNTPLSTQQQLIQDTVVFVFSWVILMPIAVIVAGKCLAQRLSIQVRSKQIFKIPLVIFHIEANGDEVILGFAGFIVTLLLIGGFAGKQAFELVKTGFGLDTTHFNALCILSAFVTVIWTFAIYVFIFISTRNPADRRLRDEHARQLSAISNDPSRAVDATDDSQSDDEAGTA